MTSNLRFEPASLALPSESWDRWLPPGNFSLSQRFLRCAQHIEMADFVLTPYTVNDGAGHPFGVCAAYQCTIDGADLGSSKLQVGVAALRRVLPNLLRHRTLEIGNPAALSFPLRSACQVADTMSSLAAWATDKAMREHHCLVVIRDIESAAEPEAVEALRMQAFFPMALPPAYVVPLPFASFNEYLAALRARYRNNFKNCMTISALLSVDILHEFADLSDDLLILWRSIYERAGKYHRVRLTAAFFKESSTLPESRLLLLRRPDRSIAGFAILFVDGPFLRYSCTGFTREAAVGESVYFRLLYEVIRYGIEQSCVAVNLGVTTPGPKMSVGGRPVEVDAWVWHRSIIHQSILRTFTNTLLRSQAPEPRNPFRHEFDTVRDPALCSYVKPCTAYAPARLDVSEIAQ